MDKPWTKEEEEFLRKNYHTIGQNACVLKLNRTRGSVSNKAQRMSLTSKSNTEELDFSEIVSNSKNYKEVIVALGLVPAGGNYQTIKNKIKEHNLDTSHFETQKDVVDRIRRKEKIPLFEVLTIDSDYNRSHLKSRLYNEGLKTRKCELCGQGEEWKGKKMSLILDHINGIRNDNRLENLRIVCPNCNATLPTHCRGTRKRKENKCASCKKQISKQSKMCRTCANNRPRPNSRKTNRPPIDILIKEVKELGYSAVGRKYGVTDNAIRKWIKPTHPTKDGSEVKKNPSN